MAPKQNKRKRPTSPKTPTRKSIRLAALQREEQEEEAIPNPLSKTRGISILSTESGGETWEVLSSQATDRINKYIQADRPNDDKVIPTLLAFLKWLPDGGKTSFARDILNSNNDDELHAVFWNLVTGLLYPSKLSSLRCALFLFFCKYLTLFLTPVYN